ncbi:MAG TPA: transcription termination/antitermination protein NusG [Dehalococcoidia bacterium]|nr:transcription termination/antitermination protein NusG [Dehalococcoidia bacterium]
MARVKKKTLVAEAPTVDRSTVALSSGAEAGEASFLTEEAHDDGRQWYVIHTYAGYEHKVKANLEHRVRTMDVQDRIFRVVIPTEEEIEIRDGQKRTVQKKVFPGYVLVQLIMDERSWYVVRNTPGVTGFVGMGTRPTALSPKELKAVFQRMRAREPRIRVGFSTGESVRITDGPFTDFVGQVTDINLEKGRVKVLVSFFGRETPVELDFLQVARL